MTATAEETELEGQMIGSDRNDIHQTFARVTQQRAAAARANSKAVKQDPPWREPTTDEIRDEQRLLGASFNDARNALRCRLAADARRLKSAAPSAADEITLALFAADEAKRAAEEMLEARQVVLNNLEAEIYQLGNLRLKIRLIESLGMDEAREKATAHRALGFFLAKQGVGFCVQTESEWQSSLKDLTCLTALRPHLGEFLKPMEAQANELVASIRAIAATAKINLGNFMQLLARERGQRPGANLSHDLSVYKGVI